jgi:lipid A disaccharide synthetase
MQRRRPVSRRSVTTKTYNIMMVAGEASGDLHAAKLAAALAELSDGRIKFFGAAGPKMRGAGS